MSIPRLAPPLEYLRAASRASLQSFELARLNHASNLRAEIGALIDQWIQETSEANLARWMLDHQASFRDSPLPVSNGLATALEFPADILPDSPPPSSGAASAPPRFAPAGSLRGAINRKPQKPRSTAVG